MASRNKTAAPPPRHPPEVHNKTLATPAEQAVPVHRPDLAHRPDADIRGAERDRIASERYI